MIPGIKRDEIVKSKFFPELILTNETIAGGAGKLKLKNLQQILGANI